ncbi:hypothetical protein ANCCAN_10132 [Ancylostoma caninum]|uniref:Uncharacterized protein n=1 Tax=Ancylostoma caninum TaxID=29170 RepID=A0A368GLE4_ANCCA|nr:hypothetical protein ANCCAN_10132 [Ancylostoma caninum]
MDDVLNKDRAAFVRQLEASNPESRLEAQYAPTIDFTKHVKNLSVRYVSTILPSENNLDDWIVLPLFQHGQDIPIDNDGRTAILVAHAPSLERLLEMWRERLDGERHDRREKRRHRKAERREGRHRKRAEKRKRKEIEESDIQMKHCKHEDEKEPHVSGIGEESTIVPAADLSVKNCALTVVNVRDDESGCNSCENSTNYSMNAVKHALRKDTKNNSTSTGDCMSKIDAGSQFTNKHRVNLPRNQTKHCKREDEKEPHVSEIGEESTVVPTVDLSVKNYASTVVNVKDDESDCNICENSTNCSMNAVKHALRRDTKNNSAYTGDCMRQIDAGSQFTNKHRVNLPRNQVNSKQQFHLLNEVAGNASGSKSFQNCGRILKQRDPTIIRDMSTLEDCEGIMAMENQIASVQAAELAQDVKAAGEAVREIHLESDHAASNLERELNGERLP